MLISNPDRFSSVFFLYILLFFYSYSYLLFPPQTGPLLGGLIPHVQSVGFIYTITGFSNFMDSFLF